MNRFIIEHPALVITVLGLLILACIAAYLYWNAVKHQQESTGGLYPREITFNLLKAQEYITDATMLARSIQPKSPLNDAIIIDLDNMQGEIQNIINYYKGSFSSVPKMENPPPPRIDLRKDPNITADTIRVMAALERLKDKTVDPELLSTPYSGIY